MEEVVNGFRTFAPRMKADMDKLDGDISYEATDPFIIKLDKMTYKFDTVTLQVFDTPHEFLAVFDNGLLSTSNSGFSISHIEELTDLNPSSTVKRFKYQLHIKGIANPTVVFFELTNENVTAKTKTKKFIEGSTMTFYKWGWPMI